MDQMTLKQRFTVGAIGVGQGGTSMASDFMKYIGMKSDHTLSINLSAADLTGAKFIPEQNRLLLDPNMFGAGKNRDISKPYATIKKDFIFEKVSNTLKGETNLNFVFFSTDGGTGSGLGPILTALFESDSFPKANGKPTLFIGVPILPDMNAGEDGLKNTIEALKEISAISANKVGRFILVDNNIESGINDDVKRWSSINEKVCIFLKRYLFTSYLSSVLNLDFEDRYKAISVSGCHAFATFNPSEVIPSSPFVLPEGALVKKLACEVPEGTSDAVTQLITNIGCQIDEPGMRGYYPVDTEGAIPIVHFAGFSNLAKVTEKYQNWFNQIKQKSIAQQKVDSTKGTGFDSLNENKKWVDSQSTTNTSLTAEEIFSMVSK